MENQKQPRKIKKEEERIRCEELVEEDPEIFGGSYELFFTDTDPDDCEDYDW